MFEIYKDKKVFITGHTGFKGAWLSLWLKKIGAKVAGYSLLPNTNPSLYEILNLKEYLDKNFIGNILDLTALEEAINSFEPDIVFHLAAQPLVRLSYKEPIETYETNVIGTLKVLEAARKQKTVKAFVNVTTDKCYENIEKEVLYKEDDKMGGYDMYSSSKACSEILSASFRNSFLKDGFLLATARAGNVIGGGDWATDRLIPDFIRAINKNEKIHLRYPDAVRPWQHVLEPLCGYLTLGEKLLQDDKNFAQGFNFGPEKDSVLTVLDVVKKLIKNYSKGDFDVESGEKPHEATLLMLDIAKAKEKLGWKPRFSADEAIEKTAQWYKEFYSNNCDILKYTLGQIEDFEAIKSK